MPAPRYQQIIHALAADLLSGRYQPGQKIPSEAALVKKFKTSRITVGRALRELQTQGLIERRAGSGTFAAQLPEDRTALLFGLLIPDLGETEIFEPICNGIASVPEAADHALLWGHTDLRETTKEAQCWKLCQQFVSRRVAGVFFAPLEFESGAGKANTRILTALQEAKIPVVLLDRPASKTPTRTIAADVVGLNNRHAAYIATEHLISSGCRRIGFMAYQGAASTITTRMAGYYDALRDHGLIDNTMRLMAGSEEPIVPASGELEAYVCVNDRVASILMRAFLSQGIRIPQDIRLVGIDDVRYAKLLPVPLTTVRQPCHEIGQAALRAMLERVKNPKVPAREILLNGELVVRESAPDDRAVSTTRP